jgi:hypothetical protein
MLFIDTIYLLQTREFLGTNVFKIGRTCNIIDRFKSYPKNSVLLYFATCSNAVVIEKQIITLFTQKYIKRKDLGNEYFEGIFSSIITDLKQMLFDDVPLEITTYIKPIENIDDDIKDNNIKDNNITDLNIMNNVNDSKFFIRILNFE